MCVILQSWCQIQHTFPGLGYVNCGTRHIKCNYSYVYSGFNIQVSQSALLLETCRHFDALYTANLVTNTAHIVQFTLYELWSRTYTKYLQLRIFMLQYSAVGICAAIVDITTIQCALYCKFGGIYSACEQCLLDNSMRVILQTWSQIQRTTSRLR
jgi:hypothetical protein